MTARPSTRDSATETNSHSVIPAPLSIYLKSANQALAYGCLRPLRAIGPVPIMAPATGGSGSVAVLLLNSSVMAASAREADYRELRFRRFRENCPLSPEAVGQIAWNCPNSGTAFGQLRACVLCKWNACWRGFSRLSHVSTSRSATNFLPATCSFFSNNGRWSYTASHLWIFAPSTRSPLINIRLRIM